jgi:outer membrane protein OmpA-like peptidoglycan-associated protein
MLKKRLLIIILVGLLIQGCASSIKHSSGHQRKERIVSNVVMFILDTSGSMNEQDLGKIRIDQAKKSVIKTVSQLDRNRYNASLITFEECNPKLAVKPSGNLDRIVNITRYIEAKGSTPLANAIRFSGEVLENIENKMVILLSDGKETCGGNPVAEAQKLHEKYDIKINFQVIGYAVDDNTRRELENISRVSKAWSYHDAKDYIDLEKIIDEIMTKNNLRSLSWRNANEFVFEFDTGSAQLSEEYSSKIKEMHDYLKNNNKHIRILGHTDSVGLRTSNYELSKKRAKVVRNELVRLGINPNRITTDGKGEEEPIARNDTEKGRRRNRRVEILIQNP